MIILDTSIHCHDCGKELPYDLAVLIDITLDSKRHNDEHVCILCDDCSQQVEA